MADSANPPGPESAPDAAGQEPVKKKKQSRLVFYMAVVGIVVLLAAIAIPNFINARKTGCMNSCIANLKQIQGSVEQWALENKKEAGSAVTLTDISGDATKHIKAAINSDIKCPSGGTYVIATVGANPTCSTGGTHALEK